jgi:hypothetical protein
VSFRRSYGAGPLHLIAVIASLALAGYAFLEIADRPAPLNFALWFALAIVAHDLLAFPLYSLLDAIAGRALPRVGGGGRIALNHLRVPALLSGLALVVWFPLILDLDGAQFEAATGLSADPYFGRWLLLTAVLFAGSGLVMALRLRASARGGD